MAKELNSIIFTHSYCHLKEHLPKCWTKNRIYGLRKVTLRLPHLSKREILPEISAHRSHVSSTTKNLSNNKNWKTKAIQYKLIKFLYINT